MRPYHPQKANFSGAEYNTLKIRPMGTAPPSRVAFASQDKKRFGYITPAIVANYFRFVGGNRRDTLY